MKWGYLSNLGDLVADDCDNIIGQLIHAAAESGFSEHRHTQTQSWIKEIEFLKTAGAEIIGSNSSAANWPVFLEYEIPRRERRIDTVILASAAIIVIEFKVGATLFDSGAVWQVREYALDLRDFHQGSRGHVIYPILVASDVSQSDPVVFPAVGERPPKLVAPVARIRPEDLGRAVLATQSAEESRTQPLAPERWGNSAYRPTLNIIEAAEAIFSGHHVREIAHAASDNLEVAGDAILRAVRRAQAEKRRVVCFVTGVPGAGKTLVGLTLVHNPELRADNRSAAVFLSGNGPLVRIVRTALVRDLKREVPRSRSASRVVSTFVQNVHQFLKVHGSLDGGTPPEHVVVFDEAQRAWDGPQMAKKGRGEWSEPQMMLRIMEGCADWSVVVALVGGGQEIHTGEAGLQEWGRAICSRPVTWDVLVSPEALTGGASVAGQQLFPDSQVSEARAQGDTSLHLNVSIRSFRAKVVADWVNAVLDGDAERAKELLVGADEFPLAMTRDLASSRTWLRSHSSDEKRPGACGLVASSGALRLRAFGLEVSSGFRRAYPYEEWFLATADDVRSASRLEVVATEFECQGLELDWVGVCWGGDFLFDRVHNKWATRRFVGARWNRVTNAQSQQYVLNKYRVLLTRARRGMVVWVPTGNPADPTLAATGFDETADFLSSCGLQRLPL